MNSSPHEELTKELQRSDIVLPTEQVELLDRYRAALWRWNEQLNLTRHTTHEKFVERDVTDSLQLAQLLEQGERVLDVGTGGGFPAWSWPFVVPICALAFPNLRRRKLGSCRRLSKN